MFVRSILLFLNRAKFVIAFLLVAFAVLMIVLIFFDIQYSDATMWYIIGATMVLLVLCTVAVNAEYPLKKRVDRAAVRKVVRIIGEIQVSYGIFVGQDLDVNSILRVITDWIKEGRSAMVTDSKFRRFVIQTYQLFERL